MKLDVFLRGSFEPISSFSFTCWKGSSSSSLTDAAALKVFKQIKWESDVKSFLTHEFFAIPVSLAILAAGSFIPPVGVALTAARVLTIVSSVLLMGAVFFNEGELSAIYQSDSQKADTYIKVLEVKVKENKTYPLLHGKSFSVRI